MPRLQQQLFLYFLYRQAKNRKIMEVNYVYNKFYLVAGTYLMELDYMSGIWQGCFWYHFHWEPYPETADNGIINFIYRKNLINETNTEL